MRGVEEFFAHIEDPRRTVDCGLPGRPLEHPMAEVLFAALCAALCGCRDFDDIAEFAELRLAVTAQVPPQSAAYRRS
jgi:DDE_Tnp_1-associated